MDTLKRNAVLKEWVNRCIDNGDNATKLLKCILSDPSLYNKFISMLVHHQSILDNLANEDHDAKIKDHNKEISQFLNLRLRLYVLKDWQSRGNSELSCLVVEYIRFRSEYEHQYEQFIKLLIHQHRYETITDEHIKNFLLNIIPIQKYQILRILKR